MSQRTKNLLIIIGVLVGLMILIIAIGKFIPQPNPATSVETESPDIENDDVTAKFPDEGDSLHRFKNECGKFVEYINSCFESATGDDLYELINKDAMISREGSYITSDELNQAIASLKHDMPKGKLFLKDVVCFDEQDSYYSPAAIISSVYAEPVGDSPFIRDFKNGRTLYIYVYTDKDNHIRSFFFVDMDKGEFGTLK